MESSLAISIFALIFSLISIIWNIIRDILLDKVRLSLQIYAGEEITDENGKLATVSAGSKINVLGKDRKILPKKICFKITNIGRRDIEVDYVMAKYNKRAGWFLPLKERRYLKPYESTNGNTENYDLKEHLKNGTLKRLFVQDTKGKKWNFSRREIFNTSKQLNIK